MEWQDVVRHARLLALTASLLVGCSNPSEVSRVDSPEAAIAKARAAWTAVHDKTSSSTFDSENISRFEPYTATLVGDVWTVKGTIPTDFHGTVPEATIRQSDGFTSVEGKKL
jgi:hypothetical protein